MTPLDVVLGACGDQHCTDTKMILAPTVSSQDKDSTHFVLRAVLTGSLARTLIDTGATASYVSTQFVNTSEQLTAIRTDIAPISVRLDNITVQIVKEQITTTMWIGEESYETTFLVMPLPSGVDAILGMNWLNANDIWLHPASKRMLVPGKPGTKGPHNALHTLANLCSAGADDSHLVREAHLHDVATKKFLLGEHDQPSSHDKRQPVPLGMAWMSEDKLSESYNVNASRCLTC